MTVETGNHRSNLWVLKDTFRAVQALEWLVVKSEQCRDVCTAFIVGKLLLRPCAVASSTGFANSSDGFNNINGIYRFGQQFSNLMHKISDILPLPHLWEGGQSDDEDEGGKHSSCPRWRKRKI